MSEAKPFMIQRQQVMGAYLKVKANKGGAGVDAVNMLEFDKNTKQQLYRIWNRMSSGSYMPPPVKLVEIEKKDGGIRPLGIPTIADRIAQTVVADLLGQQLDKVFHEDSYGYRPGKSGPQALAKARERCWKYNWVLDLDIRSFFGAPGEARQLQQVKFLSQKGLSLPTEDRALSLLGNETG